MPSDTRQRLIETATARFYRDGFRNVGLDSVLDDVGISKTAFYKHFQSKDDLMLAVLQQQSDWLRNHFIEVIRAHGGASAAGQLRALFDAVGQIIESDGFHGCIFVNAAMEFPLPHEPAHQAAAANKAEIERLVHDIAERAGASDPAGLARELCLIMEGAYITRQVTGRPDTIDVARRVAERVIQAYLSEKEKPRPVRRKLGSGCG
jgi:AcrR family transcriptional regulator